MYDYAKKSVCALPSHVPGHGRQWCEIHPSNRETSINAIQACLGLWLALLEPIASPNSPNGRFNPPPASHPPTPFNVPSVILQWF